MIRPTEGVREGVRQLLTGPLSRPSVTGPAERRHRSVRRPYNSFQSAAPDGGPPSETQVNSPMRAR